MHICGLPVEGEYGAENMLQIPVMNKMNKNEQFLKSAGNGPESFGICWDWY